MIRFRRLQLDLLEAWLSNQGFPPAGPAYRLRVWREKPAEFDAILPELHLYFDEAFEDARNRIRRGFAIDLSPFNDPSVDPASNYPALLHPFTLQGYLGETLAVLGVEHWGAHGHNDWSVPAFLFRMHDQEFQHLEMINERLLAGVPYDPEAVTQRRPGRTGDDALAFRINDANVITDVLTLEAKCLVRNRNDKIEEAHAKLSVGLTRPSGIRELINLLADYPNPQADLWRRALLELWRSGWRTATRYDGIAYACGESPAVPASRVAWMSSDAPHAAYTAGRPLEGFEYQFANLQSVVDRVFRRAGNGR